jgi:hypothetical protein
MAGRHRNPTGVRIGRWLAAVATAVVVVVVGSAITNTELTPEEKFREFVDTGAMGEWFSTLDFDLNVLAAHTATTLSPDSGVELDTAGVWLLVRVQVMADQEPVWLDLAQVRDSSGRTWSATERTDQPLVDQSYRLDPRIPVEGAVAFEVPRGAATDLTFRLGEDTNSLYGLQMATVAEVPLEIDEPAIAGGLAAPEPAVLEAPKIVIADPQVLNGVEETGR